jgi:hypothetical protein
VGLLAASLGVGLVCVYAQVPPKNPDAPNKQLPPTTAVPPPQACFHGPNDQLCPDLPHDITEKIGMGYSTLSAEKQRDFDNFAWQTFVALNWPADRTGAPLKKSITERPDAPRVWEFYPSPFALFSQGLPGENMAVKPLAMANGKRRVFSMLSTRTNLPDLSSDSILQAASDKPLIDRNLNFTLYDIAINQIEYDYIKNNGLNTIKGQQAFYDNHNQVSFPLGFYQDDTTRTGGSAGAIEIKTAWRMLDPSQGDRLDRYYTVDATIQVDAQHSQSGRPMTIEAKLGLVGFHVIQRTKQPSPQDWIWSTFEHMDNAPLADNARDPTLIAPPIPTQGTPPASVTQAYSYFNPNYHGPTNVPPALGSGESVYKWAPRPPFASAYANPGGFGTQVVRCWQIFPATDLVNKYFQKLLKGSVWENYQLIGSQWMGGTENQPGANGNIPRYLSNTTLETYIQFSSFGSCLECHNSAATKVKGLGANFSFLLERAN